MVASPILPAPPLPPKTRFLMLDLNGVFVQCMHCSRVPTMHFCKPKDANYDGFPTYIKSIFVHLWLWLWRFLQIAQSKWWVIVWSFMKFENTQEIVEFIFKGLETPWLVIGYESSKSLYAPDSKVVKKPNNLIINQYLMINQFYGTGISIWSVVPTTFIPPVTTC